MPLAMLSLGEPWHNLRHVDPICARHRVRPGQVDICTLSDMAWAISPHET
jgi:fatty-acid desaturase